jgi:AcrR family transcriptional regulator
MVSLSANASNIDGNTEEPATTARRRRLRRDERQALTREALLEAAMELFDAKGFVATSIADIAEAAGYTTGALYSNFTGKEDLYLAALERRVTAEAAALQRDLSAEPTVQGRFHVIGRWYASLAGEGRRRTRAFAEMALLGQGGTETRDRLRAQRAVLRQGIANLLAQQGEELGIEFRMPLPALADAVLALLEGFALGAAIEDEVDSATVEQALEVLLAPVRVSRSSAAR